MYLEIFKLEERFGLCFWRLSDKKKGTTKTLGSYKVTSKLCVMYLDVKLFLFIFYLFTLFKVDTILVVTNKNQPTN